MRDRRSLWLTMAAPCVVAWGLDANLPDRTAECAAWSQPVPATSEGTDPSGPTCSYGDMPPSWLPAPALPTESPPPTCGLVETSGDLPGDPTALWQDDRSVFAGPLQSPPGGDGTERMLSQDYSYSTNIIYAAVIPSPGETLLVCRSADGGINWSRCLWAAHAGWVLSSPEVVVDEGSHNYGYVFFKSTANNGDIYGLRWNLSGGSSTILTIKADADTVANISAAADFEYSHYYLYLTYEQRGGGAAFNALTMRSVDYGTTWMDAGGTIIDTRVSPKPDICFGRWGRIYLAFADKRQSSRPDTTSLRVKISTDRGLSWLESEEVGSPTVPVSEPLICAAHVSPAAWLVHQRDMNSLNGTGDGIFSYYSDDEGSNWTYCGDQGVGGGNTPSNERLPSMASNKISGSVTLTYSVVPSGSLMFTYAAFTGNDWTIPLKVNEHSPTGNFASAAGWKKEGIAGYFSSVLYAAVGPASPPGTADAWYDAWWFAGTEDIECTSSMVPTLSAQPNPAARIATISYSLSRSGFVDLSVFDKTGRHVARLEQGTKHTGAYKASWDCRGAVVGVYLVRLHSPEGVTTNRMVVAH